MALSRYRNVNYINEPKLARHYESIEFPDKSVFDQIPSIKIRLVQFDRLDQLAFKHLGAGEYWWVIAMMNDIDWMYNFEAGTIIRIPVNIEDVLKLI